MKSIAQLIAEELNVRVPQVEAAIALLDDKATVPFIARYRKEATGGLDDTQLRALDERLTYLRELDERRAAILKSIEEQGKLTPELAAADPRRRHQGAARRSLPALQGEAAHQGADRARGRPRAAGARRCWHDPTLDPEAAAAAYVDADKGVADAAAALEGARWILMETFAEDAELVGGLRTLLWERGEWTSTVVPGKEAEGVKYSDYFAATEQVKTVPSHRTLALLRGRKEGFLRLSVGLPDEGVDGPTEPERRIAGRAKHREPGPRRRRVARRNRALDLEGQAARPPRTRRRTAPARAGRARSDQRVRPQPARPAAGGAGRTARHDGPRPGHPHRREGRRGRRHRQGARHRHRLSARAAQGLGGLAAHARPAGREARRAAHLDRQRHGLARNRQAGRRPDARACPSCRSPR